MGVFRRHNIMLTVSGETSAGVYLPQVGRQEQTKVQFQWRLAWCTSWAYFQEHVGAVKSQSGADPQAAASPQSLIQLR